MNRGDLYVRLAPWLYTVGLFAIWEVAVRALGIPTFFLPPPSAIAEAFVEFWGAIYRNSLFTLSTTLIGLVVATRLIASPTLAVGLFGAAGLVHGYALGESIIGAEPTPLAAYFVGLAVVQCVIAGAAYFAALHLGTTTERLAPRSVTAAGSVIALTGVYFAASAAGLLA